MMIRRICTHETGKKWGFILVVCLISILLSSCGAKSPKKNDIENDLYQELQNYNSNLALKEFEVIRSQSSDSSYSATYNVAAESQYATFTLSADVFYSKYDQGWMLDSCQWTENGYQVTNWPELDNMDDLIFERQSEVSECFANIEYSETDNDGVDIFYASGTIDSDYEDFINVKGTVISSWKYDPETDSFNYYEDDGTNADISMIPKIEGTCLDENFSFTSWGDYNYLIVTDMTGNSFTVESTYGDGSVHNMELVTDYYDLQEIIKEYEATFQPTPLHLAYDNTEGADWSATITKYDNGVYHLNCTTGGGYTFHYGDFDSSNIAGAGNSDSENNGKETSEEVAEITQGAHLNFTADEFLQSVANTYVMAHDGNYEFGDSTSDIPCEDGKISGDRLISRSLWNLGLTNQPAGGVRMNDMEEFLLENGLVLCQDLAQNKMRNFSL